VAQQLDIGFGDIVVPPRLIEYPTIINSPAPKLRGYSKESIVAEKFQSFVTLGILKSRMKDYFGIWTLSRQFDFDGLTLSDAIARTFSNRRCPFELPRPCGKCFELTGSLSPKMDCPWDVHLQLAPRHSRVKASTTCQSRECSL
jgi:Nucleotidyl transferase AbiEii toxin, Type IV TA system